MYNKHLDTFLTVAECGSFRKAAERLYISSSAIIQQIDLLEQSLQVRLFHRTKRGIRLTSAGEYLVEEARSYISRGEQIRRHMLMLNSEGNSICVGTSEADKCRLLYDLWILFSQRQKGYTIQLLLIDGSPDSLHGVHLIESVRDGAPWQKDWEFLEICQVPVGCAVAKDHPCFGKNLITLSDMRRSGLIFIDRSHGENTAALLHKLQEEQIPYESYSEWTPSLIWECSMEKKMLLAPMCLQDVLHDVYLTPCVLQDTLPYGLFYHKNPPVPLQVFLDFVRELYSGNNPDDIIPVL